MDYPFSQLLMVVQCQRPSAILNHQDFPLRTFAIKRHWHQAKKLLEEASRQQLMLRFGTLITCAIARCRNHQLEHFPNSAATLWYNRTNYSGDMIPLYLLKMLDSKMMSSTAPKVSRIFSVLVTRVRWLLEHHPLDASCWNPPILARAYPFYSVPFFIFFLHLRVSKFKSLQVFFLGGWGPNASPAGFQVSHHIQPPSDISDLRSVAAQESWWRRVTWDAPVIFLAQGGSPIFPSSLLLTCQ